MSKFCTNCGKELNGEERFCTNCGKEVINNLNNTNSNISNSSNYSSNSSNNIRKTNTASVTGFIISLFSAIFCCGFLSLPSLIVSIVGLNGCKNKDEKGSGFAIAGIIISAIFILISAIIIIILLMSPSLFDEIQTDTINIGERL